MTGIQRFDNAMRQRSQRQPKKNPIFSGYLGIHTGGEDVVKIPSRLGFVWVRLRNVNNEVIQAFNEDVSPIMNLPVRVERDLSSPTRYKVIGRDIDVYGSNWGTASPYIGPHAGQHSFNKADTSTGGDIVWVYSDQFLPFLVTPSGTAGAGNVLIFPGVYEYDEGFHYAGGTGTASLLTYKPTGTTASLLLVSLDKPTGNFLITSAGAGFDAALTGTWDVITRLPETPYNNKALSGVRLVSGTSTIGWPNLYDARSFGNTLPTVWKDVDLVPGTIGHPSTNPPDSNDDIGFVYDLFDDGTEEQVFHKWSVPADFAEGAASCRGYFRGMVINEAGATYVAMGFEWLRVSAGDSLPADFSVPDGGGSVNITIANGEGNRVWHESATGVCNTTNWVHGDTIFFRFFRDVNGTYTGGDPPYDDDYVGDAWIGIYHLEYYSVLRGEHL